MAGPLTGVMPAARALSRQGGWAQHPFLGAGATVQGTQLHGWSPRLCFCPLLVRLHGTVAGRSTLS